MIRYENITKTKLISLVDQHKSDWRTRAGARTAAVLRRRAFGKDKSIWGDIKLVFMRLQYYKCIFCERPLAAEEAGSIEQDVEHFRPKSSVKVWPAKQRKGSPPQYAFPTGEASKKGYYWLAYDLENYAAACKPCNSVRKSNYFPIAGRRANARATVRALNRSERPYLIFPCGKGDSNPEDLLEFEGIIAKARHKTGLKYHRALVTIDFFGLNSREELWADRFRTIQSMWADFQLITTSSSADQRAAAQRRMTDHLADYAPQASCARSFRNLIDSDLKAAWRIYQAAEEFMRSTRHRGGGPPAR